MELSKLLIFKSNENPPKLNESYHKGKFIDVKQPKFGLVSIEVQDVETEKSYTINVKYVSTWYGKYKHLNSIEFSDKDFNPSEDNPAAYYDDITEKLLTSNELKFYFLEP